MPVRQKFADSEQEIELKDALSNSLNEARMILPGIQALFGFQLIAVFNSAFAAELAPPLQVLHYMALILTVLSTALLMAPAAYDRQTNPRKVSEWFVAFSGQLICVGMIPLLLSITLDVFIIGNVVLHSWLLATFAGLFCGGWMGILWFALPHLVRSK